MIDLCLMLGQLQAVFRLHGLPIPILVHLSLVLDPAHQKGATHWTQHVKIKLQEARVTNTDRTYLRFHGGRSKRDTSAAIVLFVKMILCGTPRSKVFT